MSNNYAVVLRDACKHYGPSSGPKRNDVLNNLNMTVEKGIIYGLLGPSGCGKTTLLSCIVGCRKLNTGKVWVLGGTPGSPESRVPGPSVGYMPQETALVDEFTVESAIYFFGRIYGMHDSKIKERFLFLSSLLNLPPKNRLIKNCSGGQQRRVSFAASLIHEPELLILDEPTVGLDPVLRDNIWKFLTDLVSQKNIAVIITTHYIEEAKQADRIGLMRNGKLLAENSPTQLLSMFGTDLLEEVFLVLSKKQATGDYEFQFENNVDFNQKRLLNMSDKISVDDLVSDPKSEKSREYKNSNNSMRKMKALLHKNWLSFAKHPGGLLFSLFFPILVAVSFFYGVGGDIKDIKIGIVNDESNWTHCENYMAHYPTTVFHNENYSCSFHFLSCRFIDSLHDSIAIKVYHDNIEEAIYAATKGYTIGYIHLANNFTAATEAVRKYQTEALDEDLESSQISVSLDMTNAQVGTIVQVKLLRNYIEFARDVLKDCKNHPKYGDIPVKFEPPIYGYNDMQYIDFMTPGCILILVFFLATLITSTLILAERLGGIWDRSLVAGVTTGEIMLTHLITQFLVMLVQTIESVILVLYIFQINCLGDVFSFSTLVILQGFTGMCFGFFVSCISQDYVSANIISGGSFYPMILLCGIAWPMEGMPKYLRYFSMCLPFSVPTISLRNVMAKGWNLLDFEVFNAVLISGVWITFFCLLSFIAMKRNK